MLNQFLIAHDDRSRVLNIAIVSAVASLTLGVALLALAPPDKAAIALAASQLAASVITLALLLAVTTPRHLVRSCVPGSPFCPWRWRPRSPHSVASSWPPAAVFALQAVAGTAAFAVSLPFLLRRKARL